MPRTDPGQPGSVLLSPDGSLRVEYLCVAGPRMSHEIWNPRVTHVPTGRVVFDAWDSDVDGHASFDAAGRLVLETRVYPGTEPPETLVFGTDGELVREPEPAAPSAPTAPALPPPAPEPSPAEAPASRSRTLPDWVGPLAIFGVPGAFFGALWWLGGQGAVGAGLAVGMVAFVLVFRRYRG